MRVDEEILNKAKAQMEAILLSVGFSNFQVIKKPSGLYIYAKNLKI